MTNVNWFTSLAWNDSEYDDDYTVTNGAGVPTVVPVAGKQVTDTPEILFKSQIGYDNGSVLRARRREPHRRALLHLPQ